MEGANVTKFRKEQQESAIAFKLGANGVPRFLDKTATVADALALYAFARQVAEQEIARLTARSLDSSQGSKIAA